MAGGEDASLVVLRGSDERLRGQWFPLGHHLTLGRRPDAGVDLAIDDKLLSGCHASLVRVPGGYELVDHQSKNGSFVDGERVERSRAALGAVLRLGVHVFEVVRGSGTYEPFDAGAPGDESHALVGRSPALRRLVAAVDALARGGQDVLLVGEHGVGKEAAARRLHAGSARPGPFVAFGCASVIPATAYRMLFGALEPAPSSEQTLRPAPSERTGLPPASGPRAASLLEEAHGGTLFLDGVDALDGHGQAALAEYLKARDEGRTTLDVRLVAGTDVDLDPLVYDGTFSEALLARLQPRTAELPSLRARRTDIPDIVRHAWAALVPRRSLDVSATCLEKLMLHDWPMNVRELVGMLGRVLATAGPVTTLRSAHLPSKIRDRVLLHTVDQLRASAVDIEIVPSREELAELLRRHDGDVATIASFFSRDKRQVYRWLKRHDLKLSAFRPAEGR